jgi:hypothetical protein
MVSAPVWPAAPEPCRWWSDRGHVGGRQASSRRKRAAATTRGTYRVTRRRPPPLPKHPTPASRRGGAVPFTAGSEARTGRRADRAQNSEGRRHGLQPGGILVDGASRHGESSEEEPSCARRPVSGRSSSFRAARSRRGVPSSSGCTSFSPVACSSGQLVLVRTGHVGSFRGRAGRSPSPPCSRSPQCQAHTCVGWDIGGECRADEVAGVGNGRPGAVPSNPVTPGGSHPRHDADYGTRASRRTER